ncbi:MAG: TldD/PmbA family protein [Bdellovibrionaceae bacterium]|nr:TldD/PmbA family protein [Pseudobdellovibrionaceae bacterium]
MQPLPIRPQTLAFDPVNALKWVRGTADWVGLRFVQEAQQSRGIRNQKPETQNYALERGVQIEVLIDGHLGYASTSDLTEAGLKRAATRAAQLSKKAAASKVFTFTPDLRPQAVGKYMSPVVQSPDELTLQEFISFLIEASRRLKVSDDIVNAAADVMFTETHQHVVSTSGTDFAQDFLLWTTNFTATAQRGGETQRRSLNGPVARCVQGGAEILDREFLLRECETVGRQALELLAAENCPTGKMDLILAPDQMLLQIHESIGHPLELDRILGDERNYAGWSFVKPADFGSLKYGSSIMNVTFDPSPKGEFASYGFDDCGNPARREYLIENGILVRGLGSLESQKRSGLPGVANFRSSSWNRAPIDRMANINLEPGETPLEDMISSVKDGVYMEANSSWSIDDYRNKFQFGCEYGRRIQDGKLTHVVKNPNYRGVTVPFWRGLQAVGRAQEVGQFGSPYCGKGEPSQVIRVGHSSPPCLFSQVEVFGGGQ